VDVVLHQQERVELAVVLALGFAKVVEVATLVGVVKKERLTIVPALHDVLRNLRHVAAIKVSHSPARMR